MGIFRRRDLLYNLTIKNCDKVEKFNSKLTPTFAKLDETKLLKWKKSADIFSPFIRVSKEFLYMYIRSQFTHF